MPFRSRTAYGLVALLELAARHAGGDVLQVGEIARRQGIPARYQEQPPTSLRRAGLLSSRRGPRGGYRLARPPAQITVAEVVECLEGVPVAERRSEPGTPEFAVVAGLEAALERRRRELLGGRTLEQLLQESVVLGASPVMYFI
ncbi:MAG: Rrf2 family transcriptional regulator [Synechococcaceae cyanobacterium]|nr:Rrf2 family transcriptional regulator [Synechococcaceae cyanobacterium]